MASNSSFQNSRIGFHYYPDTYHYRESDLHAWIPELRSLGAAWLTLTAPTDRAIPEYFINGLLRAGIEPILHFQVPPETQINLPEIKIFLDSYAKWGVQYAVFYDRPNSRKSWSGAGWAQEGLVERFLDKFIPLAEIAIQSGLHPVFAPLEPGGDYWDTAFLQSALKSLQRRNQTEILAKLTLSAYAWTGTHSLNWGAGGPERWPGVRPYFTPSSEEDQRGFRIFDWYLAISQLALGHSCPIIIFAAGSPLDHRSCPAPDIAPVAQAQTLLNIARLLNQEKVTDPLSSDQAIEPVPADVLACNFWLLTDSANSSFVTQAWFQPSGTTLPVVGVFRQWISSRSDLTAPKSFTPRAIEQALHPLISHYLLLPKYDWGVADWHLDIIRPFVKRHQPTIGFSLDEAEHASRVTVIGGPQAFPDAALDHLRSSGCIVERINGDGTTIATLLAER
jgi:hypothetical protein